MSEPNVDASAGLEAMDPRPGSGLLARVAVWLALAASPTFMLMAGVAIADTPAMATCLQTSSRLSAGSMAVMYLLMGVFHLSPWLRLAATAPRL